jgi:hypothetical protein
MQMLGFNMVCTIMVFIFEVIKVSKLEQPINHQLALLGLIARRLLHKQDVQMQMRTCKQRTV